MMLSTFRKYRGQLHTWFQEHGGEPQGRLTPFSGLSTDVWKNLCNTIFTSSTFKGDDKSLINQFKQTHCSKNGAWGLVQKRNI
ncbi:hypothetical protein H6P81_009765 [Aristolochia fimbriata]|uniref:Uncharacterized protein n=1 Tax=Aristolochia fimbriata TaxID=158543 RepID=A0AAV7ENV7_ARIFI|nr:hypothetical protein H6P81_009765 [Aristolochia fimbriata]